jgi:hypothetical protein
MMQYTTQRTAGKDQKTASIAANGLIAHYDKVEIAVKLTRENAHRWYRYHQTITDRLAKAIGGEVGKPKPAKGKDRRYQWKRVIVSEDVMIEISSPKKHRDQDEETDQLEDIQVLSRFSITSLNKLDYEPHLKALHSLNRILKMFEIKHHISVAEIAVDSLREELVRLFAKTAHLHRARIKDKLFNYADGGKHRKCPSEDGKEQYVGYRTQSRQLHTYYKAEYDLWRTEIILFTETLKLESLQVENLDDLLRPGIMQALLEKNIRHLALNLRKLYRDHPRAKSLRLETKTVTGAMDDLMKYLECSKREINKYITRADGLLINYLSLSIGFDQLEQKNQTHNESDLEALLEEANLSLEPEQNPVRKPIFDQSAYDVSMLKAVDTREEPTSGWNDEMERLSREFWGNVKSRHWNPKTLGQQWIKSYLCIYTELA